MSEKSVVLCVRCGYHNVSDGEDVVVFCDDCGFTIECDVCDLCGGREEPVIYSDDGKVCDSCFKVCDNCGEMSGCEWVGENSKHVCKSCMFDEGRFCEGCNGWFGNDDLYYQEEVGEFCYECFEEMVEANGWERCDDCGEYKDKGELVEYSGGSGVKLMRCEECRKWMGGKDGGSNDDE